jgi:hypothetical protein
MMKPEPKLMEDGTAELCSGRHRLTGKEDAGQDLCKEFRIIPADGGWMENENQIALGNLAMLTFCDQCVQAGTTIPFGIIAVSMD